MFSAQVLIKLREARGLSVQELAAALDVSAQWLKDLEAGKIHWPRPPYMEKLTRFFGVDQSEFMNLDGSGLREKQDAYVTGNPGVKELGAILTRLGELDLAKVDMVVWFAEAVLQRVERERKEELRKTRRG